MSIGIVSLIYDISTVIMWLIRFLKSPSAFINYFKTLLYLSSFMLWGSYIAVFASSCDDLFSGAPWGTGSLCFLLVFLIQTPRVLITFCITLFYLIFSPWILRKILKKRRQRIRLIEMIRRSRSEDSLDAVLPEDPNDDPQNNLLPVS